MDNYRKNHDLSLSSWGPYSKRYVGISHIPSVGKGKRFDLSVFPSLYRRGLTVPNVMWESDYYPWNCTTDLTKYTHRHELLWKDKIYTDISFSVQDETHTLFHCRSVNNTGSRQAIVFHYMASLHFPPVRTYSREPVRAVNAPSNEELFFVDGLEYKTLIFKENAPQRNLSPDGTIWGEVRDHGFTGGSGLGNGFGNNRDDLATYSLPEQWDRSGKVYIRFRASKGAFDLILHGALEGNVRISASGNWDLAVLNCRVNTELATFDLSAGGGEAVEIDGFVFCNAAFSKEPVFVPCSLNPSPTLVPGLDECSLVLKYEDVDCYYGLAWEIPAVIRQWECEEPDNIMKHNVHEHNDKLFRGEGAGHFTEVFTRPVYLEGASEQVQSGLVCCGTEKHVRKLLEDFSIKKNRGKQSWTGFREEERLFTEENEYAFSVNRLVATALLNVVYPVRVQGSWIRHHTPGRWWDCLYTWDSGFIGLGFTAIDAVRAEETLNTYLTLPGNSSAAFIHHGSPVPTQFFLYKELFNRSCSTEILEKYYDSLLQYHRFMAGRQGSSTTAALKSGLLKTWDYFYNSGGWDDYCPQVHIRKKKMEDFVTPVITTAMTIRTALILKGAARILNRPSDELDRDIENLTSALQEITWDPEAGYFSYMVHDEKGQAREILRDETGSNYNRGFDGVYPLNAGVCTVSQETGLLEKLFSPNHLWSSSGLTAIDQSAPYFKDNGYWNGAVWMAHQWVFWKTMLDLGKGEQAFKIASTALKIWKRETEDTYNCFEHFVTSTGKGAGWHQFGGLSSPVINWYSSYYVPGTVSTGHDTWILEQSFSNDHGQSEVTLMNSGYKKRACTVLVVLNSDVTKVTVHQGDRTIPYVLRQPGVVEIMVPEDAPDTYMLCIHGAR